MTTLLLMHCPITWTYYPEHADIDADIQQLVHPDCHAAILLLLLHVADSC